MTDIEQQSPTVEESQAPQISGRAFVLTLIIVSVTVSLIAAYSRFRLGPDKENYVVRSLFSVVEQYVESHDGAWPSSWDDLESLPETGAWYEPMNFEMAREIVDIDFEAKPEELAKQSPGQFEAIRPKRPVLDYRSDPRVTSLLETIRRMQTKPDASE